MKVLIFGIPNSGTSSLYKFIVQSFPKHYISKYEPFKRTTEVEWGDDCIVKTVFSKEPDPLLFKNNETLLEHSLRIVKEFDKVIYIKRKPTTDSQLDEWNITFDLVAGNNKVYFYEDIFKDEPSESLYELCEYLNIELDMKLFDSYIHIKNKYIKQKKEKSVI